MDHNVLVYGVRIWSKKLCYWFHDIYLFDRKSEDDDNKKSGALICILNIKPFNRMSVILFMTMMLFATNSSAYKKVIRNTNHFLKDKKYIEVKKSDKS